MTTDIEREFDAKNWKGCDFCGGYSSREEILSFLREKTVSKSSLKLALTKLRKKIGSNGDGRWTYNSALDDLSKELNLDV